MEQEVQNGNGEVLSHGKTIFTSKGIALNLVGISPLLIAKLQTAGKLPDVPTRRYKLELGDGGEEEYQEEELSAGDLQDEEEEAKWKAYVTERDKVLTLRQDNFLKAIFAKGVEIDLSRLDGWREEMAYFELDIPDHPLALKTEYIQTEAIGSTEDMIEIITGVLGQSGIPEEDLEEVRAMFRDSVRRNPAGQIVDAEGEVDMEPALHGDESRPLLGSVAAE